MSTRPLAPAPVRLSPLPPVHPMAGDGPDGTCPEPVPVSTGPDEGRWLTINAACKLLGVDQSTLRRWSDAGKVPVFRTPGGHRRYDEATLRAMVGDAPRQPGSLRLTRRGPHDRRDDRPAGDDDHTPAPGERRWYRAYSPVVLDDLRRHGRRLCDLAGRFVSSAPGSAERSTALGEARLVGEHYGRVSAAAGLTPADAVEAFFHFRVPVIRSIIGLTDEDGMPARRAVRVHVELGQFLDEVLIATMRSHERQPRGRR